MFALCYNDSFDIYQILFLILFNKYFHSAILFSKKIIFPFWRNVYILLDILFHFASQNFFNENKKRDFSV